MITAFAQSEVEPRLARRNQIFIGVEGSGVLNFSAFADNRTVDQGFRKPALPTAAWGLILRQNVTYRIALEAGISLIEFGYKSVYTSQYPGSKRWEAQATSTNRIGLFQLPVRVQLLLPGKNSYWRKYLSLGANGFYNEYWDLTGNVGTQGSLGRANSGESFPIRDTRYPAPRFTVGLGLGIGLERELWQWGLLQVGAVYNLGFKPMAVWDLEYTTWDISRNLDGITYSNTIVNKGSYFGLRLGVLIKL
jgi:hypothetical protein